jgi:antitoxin protein of toxin-antitoxin system
MGLLDDVAGKAKDLAKENEDTVDAAIDSAADLADDKTGGQHTEKIDAAADQAKKVLDDE